MIANYSLNITQACDCAGIQRCVYYYKSVKKNIDANAIEIEVSNQFQELSQKYPKRGFRKLFGIIQRRLNLKGLFNHKRAYRIYLELGLNLRRKKSKTRVPDRVKDTLIVPNTPNEIWSMDFMSDGLSSGRKFRTFNIIDDFNRELLDISIDMSMSGAKIAHHLSVLILNRGTPKEIRVDNGSEFISHVFQRWCDTQGITLRFIQKGKPTQNAYIERFNRSYREDVLDIYNFENLQEVRLMSEEWMYHYNYERPHESLGDLTPVEYYEKYITNQGELVG